MSRVLPPIELLCLEAERLGKLCRDVTFLGGFVVALLVTDPAARPPRATEDVDVAIELAALTDYYKLDEQLRGLGFTNAQEGPICRYVHGLLVLDVMATDDAVPIGPTNRWYRIAVRTAKATKLPNGITINVITPACFLATKMEAFDSPVREHHGDMLASRDFEDVAVLLDGRPTIAEDVLADDPDVLSYLRHRFALLLQTNYLEEGLEAHIEFGRTNEIMSRIKAIVGDE